MTHTLFRSPKIIFVLLSLSFVPPANAIFNGFYERDVFVAGQGNVYLYRIPSLIVSDNGTVLAFCESRKVSTADSSPTDLVVKTSSTNGDVWSDSQLLIDGEKGSVTNPTAVVDRDTKRLWLFFNRTPADFGEATAAASTDGDTVTVWTMYSDDNGKTWSSPNNITTQVKRPSWTSYALGPGVAIQLKNGRLVVPCNHGPKPWRSFAFYSDDHGKSWQLGEDVAPDTNECQMVERADGSVMMNMRSYRGEKCRAVSVSKDFGKSWSEIEDDHNLIDPVCQASIIRYSGIYDGRKSRLLFSNPATVESGGKGRTHMTIRISYDEGRSWPISKLIYDGPSAYSCLAVLKDGSIGCLYEKSEGKKWGKNLRKITFSRFTLNWLTDGRDAP